MVILKALVLTLLVGILVASGLTLILTAAYLLWSLI